MHFFSQLFGSGGFQPHGFCYAWNTRLVWLHVLSDLLIAGAYFAIPLVLLWFFRKRHDIPFSWMFLLFGAFIMACGATHAMEVWNLWHAQYWLAGAVKALTAAASVGTAVLLTRLIPRILQVPNLSEWAQANADLETRVAQRTRELRQANEALRQSYETLALAQKAGKIGSWDRDVASGVSAWATEPGQAYGPKPGSFDDSSQLLRNLVHPDDLAAVDSAVEESLREGPGFATEFRIIKPGGKVGWISSRGNIIRDERGGARRMVGVNIDITEQKQAQEQIRSLNASLELRVAARTSELSDANKELESFSYSVSHDLRSPLRAIDGFSLALMEDCGQQLDEQGQDHLRRIRAATQHMGVLIDDLLNLSRVTRADFRSQICELSSAATTIAAELQKTEPLRHVDWRIQPGLSAAGDCRLLHVVLENLLSNAYKFTSKHASATIEFGETQSAGASAFFVRDDGAGFDCAYAGKLFAPFQRFHVAADFPGTGVGLATVQRIIHRHGGRIWAESAVDKGATLYFTLPQTALPGDTQ
jgi:signal transduction histidine kinase